MEAWTKQWDTFKPFQHLSSGIRQIHDQKMVRDFTFYLRSAPTAQQTDLRHKLKHLAHHSESHAGSPPVTLRTS